MKKGEKQRGKGKGEGSKREKDGKFIEENLFREVNSSKMRERGEKSKKMVEN